METKKKIKWHLGLIFGIFILMICLSGNSAPKDEIYPVFFTNTAQVVKKGKTFITEISINTGKEKVAAFDFSLSYPEDFIQIDQTAGNKGADFNDFVAVTNPNSPGSYKVSGFNVTGKGPDDNLNLVNIHWLAKKKGKAVIQLKVNTLVNEKTKKLNTSKEITVQITIK